MVQAIDPRPIAPAACDRNEAYRFGRGPLFLFSPMVNPEAGRIIQGVLAEVEQQYAREPWRDPSSDHYDPLRVLLERHR